MDDIIFTVHRTAGDAYEAQAVGLPLTVVSATFEDLPRAVQRLVRDWLPGNGMPSIQLRMDLRGPGDAPNLAGVQAALQAHRSELVDMGVKRLVVFGSVARGEAVPESDVDLLITFSRPVGLVEFAAVKSRLEEILQRRVDLATEEALRPAMRERVEREAVDAI
jgi:uncharacterized protein